MTKKPYPEVVVLNTQMFRHAIKVSDACGRAGVHPGTWSRWAKGGKPDLDALNKMHAAIDELVAEQESADA